MSLDTKRYYLAVSTLVGTIIGVGIFGVPYALSKVGLFLGIVYFVVLGAIQMLQHLFYAEATIACPDKLRLAGLAERYLGRRAKPITTVSTVFGFWGGMLAYIIVGGTFLHVLLSPLLGGEPFHYQLSWALAGAVVVFFGLDVVAKMNFVGTVGLLVAMALIFALGIPHVRIENFTPYTGLDLFLPYGVILFSLAGATAIPEMEDILRGDHRNYRRAIVVGTLIAIALTAAFGFIVWGVTGDATTDAAVTGLKNVIGDGIATLGALFGFLAVATSFLATALNLQSTFQYDLKFRRFTAWLLTGGVPFAVFLVGATSFITIIGFTGAVFGGITAVTIALLYITVTKKKLVAERPLGLPLWLAYVSIAVLVLGAVYEIADSVAAIAGK